MSDSYYLTPEWRTLRKACLERDSYRCVSCGERASVADHKIGRRRWLAERRLGSPDALSNLRSMCSTCDRRITEHPSTGGQRRNAGSTGVIGADGFPIPLPD